MVTVADKWRCEAAARAACLAAGMGPGVMLGMAVLAAAPEHPGSLGHDEEEALAGASSFPTPVSPLTSGSTTQVLP